MSEGATPEPTADEEARRLRHGIIGLLVVVILVGALLLAVPGLRSVADQFRDVYPGWVALALVLEVASCAGYVLAFQHVFWRAPRLFATRVALSELAFGAVVPMGGAGGIAVGAWVVKAKGGAVRRFAERSAVLFLLTSAVNAATLVLAGLVVGLRIVPAPHPNLLGLLPASAGVLVLAGVGALPWLGARVGGRWLRATGDAVRASIEELRAPSWRLAGAVAYLWCGIAVLWVCFRALGHAPPVSVVTLGFLIGYLANLIPVPGGVGVLDGGIAGALMLYGVSPAPAAAAALAYHAIVLWIPTLLGTLAFLRLRRTLDEPLVLRPARQPSSR
jgi:uncharacterized membrane protein YbhN (UPF0104 family)